jgi:hypothetical protein
MSFRCLNCHVTAVHPEDGIEICNLGRGCGFRVGRFEPCDWSPHERAAEIVDVDKWSCRKCGSRAELEIRECGCQTVRWVHKAAKRWGCEKIPDHFYTMQECDGRHRILVRATR